MGLSTWRPIGKDSVSERRPRACAGSSRCYRHARDRAHPCEGSAERRNMPTVFERIGRGEVIVLDGAMGTELQRRGVPMNRIAWSAVALHTHPEVIGAIHEDYILAGADIIITNSFG